jgi:glycosyltransferase involved in cell wall biosynthesis
MRSVVLVVPGRLDTRTGGYEYDRRLVEALRNDGWWVDVRELGGGFPAPTVAEREQAARVLANLPARSIVIVDGLALGVLPDEIERAASRLRLVALVHHPLALETGLPDALKRTLKESERRALAIARRVVVTSHATVAALADYAVAAEKVRVVEPGTDPAPIATGSGGGDMVQLLCVATLIARKGHDLLLQALAAVPGRNWRLSCVGSDRDPVVSRKLRDLVRQLQLTPHVTFEGEADAATIASHYDGTDVFVLPTLYEGYGMAVAEALARGLPIVSTTTGAIPEIVPDHAGVLVAPGDVPALTDALASVIGNPSARRRFAEGARRARARLPTWPMAAAKMGVILESVGQA